MWSERMTQLRNTFDAEDLGTLQSVLDEVCSELSSGQSAGEGNRRVISREELAKLILHYAQDGESDPTRLRMLVLERIGRKN